MAKERLTDQVKDYIINCHPKDFPELTGLFLAKHFRVSMANLSKKFKEEQGINLGEFLINEKLKRSRYLLNRYQNLSVNMVAKMAGYSSSIQFIRIFKKKLGVTPGRFRKITGMFIGLFDRRKNLSDRRTGLDRRGIQLMPISLNLRISESDRRVETRDRRSPIPDIYA